MSVLRPEGPLAFRVHEADDVAVALRPLDAGARITVGRITVTLTEAVTAGHKRPRQPRPRQR